MSKPAWAREMRFKPQPVMPDGVSDWDRMLYRLGLSIDEAIQSRSVREWVRKHHATKFVPIQVLEAYGIDHRFF